MSVPHGHSCPVPNEKGQTRMSVLPKNLDVYCYLAAVALARAVKRDL